MLGLVFVAVILSIAVTALLIFIGRQVMFATTMLHGPVFVPSKDDKINTMFKLAKLKKSDRIIDLGSGDGKILLALAENGFAAEGVEINPLLARKSRKKIRARGFSRQLKVHRKSFWDIDLTPYNVVFFYGTTYVMKKLELKLQSELKSGSRVVSNYFQFPNWQPKKEENGVRLYVKK